jgi:outer membrane protein assembly factor BamD
MFITGCSKYEKLLKSDNYRLKYKKAKEYYFEEDYVKAAGLFDQLKPIYKGTQKIDTILYYYAHSKYKQRQYILAAHHFKDLFDTYPKSSFAERASFYFAYCFYQTSPKPSLDQTNTMQAIEAFQHYVRRYPQGERVSLANEYIDEMRYKLIQKSFMSAKLYFQLERYKASIIALNNSLEEYPNTKYREEIMFLILKSNYLLAKNSIQRKKEERFQNTVDAYYSLAEEYPSSQYLDEAKSIYQKSNKYLNINNN